MDEFDRTEFMEDPPQVVLDFYDKVEPWVIREEELDIGKWHYVFDKNMPEEAIKVMRELKKHEPISFLYSYSIGENDSRHTE
ncbi:MAG: hypothetical protein Q4A67_07150 [Aerococcus sp.]|nr:hypothetical protein [Aerococcus sp.]